MKRKAQREIRWRAALRASPKRVYALLATDRGRKSFWADSSKAVPGGFRLAFASGEAVDCRILEAKAPQRFVFTYFGKSRVEFRLKAAGRGTDFEVRERNCPKKSWIENHAGWVAWVFCLKAAADHGVTLRSRSRKKTWGRGFVDG